MGKVVKPTLVAKCPFALFIHFCLFSVLSVIRGSRNGYTFQKCAPFYIITPQQIAAIIYLLI